MSIAATDTAPPIIPPQQFDVCDDPEFKCLWVTGEGEIMDSADARQRQLWLEVAATAPVSDEAHFIVSI